MRSVLCFVRCVAGVVFLQVEQQSGMTCSENTLTNSSESEHDGAWLLHGSKRHHRQMGPCPHLAWNEQGRDLGNGGVHLRVAVGIDEAEDIFWGGVSL